MPEALPWRSRRLRPGLLKGLLRRLQERRRMQVPVTRSGLVSALGTTMASVAGAPHDQHAVAD